MPKALKDKAYRSDPEAGDADGGSYTELLLTIQNVDAAEKDKPTERLEAICR